jgi:CheY-like chemotaxis protein
MPQMDGYELARRLRDKARLPETRIVAVTGYHDAAHRNRWQDAGFQEYLVKPPDLDELARLLQASRELRAVRSQMRQTLRQTEQLRQQNLKLRSELAQAHQHLRATIEETRETLAGDNPPRATPPLP